MHREPDAKLEVDGRRQHAFKIGIASRQRDLADAYPEPGFYRHKMSDVAVCPESKANGFKARRALAHGADRRRLRMLLPERCEDRRNEPLRMDNTRLKAVLGAEPHTPLDEAVRETLIGLGCLGAQTKPQSRTMTSRVASENSRGRR
jgi:hypothetical protein